ELDDPAQEWRRRPDHQGGLLTEPEWLEPDRPDFADPLLQQSVVLSGVQELPSRRLQLRLLGWVGAVPQADHQRGGLHWPEHSCGRRSDLCRSVLRQLVEVIPCETEPGWESLQPARWWAVVPTTG